MANFESSMLGESPPPPPRDCFGRDDLIESVVTLAEKLDSVALIGVGGIGKTSVALTILHHERIRRRFGDNRRFIRCNKFTASRANFLSRLSKVIGACIENPEDLIPLRPSLSSREMVIVLDNAESILDPHGAEGQDIFRVVEELSQFSNICLVITSRITTIPPTCETLDVPTLPEEAAREAFYHIYKHGGRSSPVDDILGQLDFHPLSITLLATVAHQNKWDENRLTREWENRRTGVLRTENNQSLGATIELSLSSPMFVGLGPNAREFLGVIAFFPQGVNEDNLNWLFPTIPNIATILDKLCMLSLTYRSDGFITMLVPLRDYLYPKDPLSSPLLRTAKESYFARLSAKSDHYTPGTKETEWIISEDANVEHLLNVLTSIDTNLHGLWKACAGFMDLLYWHKPRRTILGSNIKQLPDDHHSKPSCLVLLALLFDSVGDSSEQKRLLEHALRLERERGKDDRVALTLNELADANRVLGIYREGIHQAKEALGIFERIGDVVKQGYSLVILAWLLCADKQLDAAEEAAFHAIDLLAGKDQEYWVCQADQVLGDIYRSRGRREKAIHHFETAAGIASHFSWHDRLFWIHYSLAKLFRDEAKFDSAQAHIEQAKLHVVNDVYSLGHMIQLQAQVYHRQHRLEDATSEARRAIGIYEKLGAQDGLERCKVLLLDIERATKSRDTPMVQVSFRERYRVLHLLTLSSQPPPSKLSIIHRIGKRLSRR